jgi:RNA polymerase sigma-70 factor, ECF subfamily
MVFPREAMDFSGIYERYARDVHRFAFYLSGSHATAEDLTAETFAHALCGRTELRVGTVKAYLIAIARNLYRDALAKERRLVSIDDVPDRMDPTPSSETTVSDREAYEHVLRAIRKLPPRLREALVLATDQELRHDQIAAILGCSVGAVKVRVHRARVQLKAELDAKEQTWTK